MMVASKMKTSSEKLSVKLLKKPLSGSGTATIANTTQLETSQATSTFTFYSVLLVCLQGSRDPSA